MTTLDETINLALEEHDENVRKDETLTPEAQAFVIRHVHYAADELHRLAKTIREAMPLRKTKSWRVVSNIQDEMVAEGQCYSRFLWLANLRDKIVDKIEYTYGINFSGLSIWQQVTDSTDGQPAFVAYDPTRFQHGDSYTIAKNGKTEFFKIAEFQSRFKA